MIQISKLLNNKIYPMIAATSLCYVLSPMNGFSQDYKDSLITKENMQDTVERMVDDIYQISKNTIEENLEDSLEGRSYIERINEDRKSSEERRLSDARRLIDIYSFKLSGKESRLVTQKDMCKGSLELMSEAYKRFEEGQYSGNDFRTEGLLMLLERASRCERIYGRE